jgi:glycosyltransferase involved in cell wall biosynthesis
MPLDQKVVFVGPFAEHSGYSYMCREHVKGLLNLGWDVGIEAINCTNEISFEETQFFNSLRKFENNRPSLFFEKDVIKIVGWIPLKNIPSFKHNVIYTMMESRNVGKPFVDQCNFFYNSCWTPTKYYEDKLKEAGVEIPIKIVPIGIDKIYIKENIKEEFKLNYKVFSKREVYPNPTGYKFLSVFRWNYKKGYDVLIKSFLREFSYKDNVSLVIISKHAAMNRGKQFSEAVEKEMREVIDANSNIDSPPIYWSEDNISHEEMPSMYAIGDCFCLPSRGDGQCLPALEASRMGLPTILPYHTAFTDYVSEDTSFKFDVDGWEICNNNPLWGQWITRVYYGQEFPIFGDMVVQKVSSLMREAKSNPDLCKQKVEAMNKTIDNKYTWPICTNLASESLLEVLNDRK